MKYISILFMLGVLGSALVVGFLPIKSFAGEFSTQEQPAEPFFEEGEREEFVDPQEIKDTLRQLNDIKREAQRTLKKAQKVANFTNEVQALGDVLSQVVTFSNAIKNASGGANQREALQEFYDAQLWDVVNEIRIKVELPQELKNIEKDLKKLEKLIGSKRFSLEKIDVSVFKAKAAEIKSAVAEARDYFNEGNFEDAGEALQFIYEGGAHPGEILGVAYQLRDINLRLKSLKKDVKERFHDVLSSVYEAVQQGDFREANMMLGDIQQDLWRLFDKAKGKSGINEEMKGKLRGLEERLQNKQQQIEQEQSGPEPQSEGHVPYQPYRASILDSISHWLQGFGF